MQLCVSLFYKFEYISEDAWSLFLERLSMQMHYVVRSVTKGAFSLRTLTRVARGQSQMYPFYGEVALGLGLDYLRQGGYVFAGFCLFVCMFVCLSVCLCASKITQKVMDESFWNFEGMSAWHKLQVIQFWGQSGRNSGFCSILKFSLPLG